MRSHVYDFITCSATGQRKFKGQWGNPIMNKIIKQKYLWDVTFIRISQGFLKIFSPTNLIWLPPELDYIIVRSSRFTRHSLVGIHESRLVYNYVVWPAALNYYTQTFKAIFANNLLACTYYALRYISQNWKPVYLSIKHLCTNNSNTLRTHFSVKKTKKD